MDLLANPDSRRVFDIRFRTIAALRRQLVAEDFVEVDTPILQPQAGGASGPAVPDPSNALDIDLSLRIAPELYLKRLVVGGYERVFEMARNFRNEGIDTRHSPEFTTLEAYRAFGDVTDGMDLTERLIVEAAAGSQRSADLHRRRPTDRPVPAVAPATTARLAGGAGRPNGCTRRDPVDEVRAVCERHVGGVPARVGLRASSSSSSTTPSCSPPWSTRCSSAGFPVEVSPLARRTEDDPTLADRFELAIDGKEYANGYSELNIPEEQQERFRGRG